MLSKTNGALNRRGITSVTDAFIYLKIFKTEAHNNVV